MGSDARSRLIGSYVTGYKRQPLIPVLTQMNSAYIFSYFYHSCVIHTLVVHMILYGQYRILRQIVCFSLSGANVRFCRTHFPLRALLCKMIVEKARLFLVLLN